MVYSYWIRPVSDVAAAELNASNDYVTRHDGYDRSTTPIKCANDVQLYRIDQATQRISFLFYFVLSNETFGWTYNLYIILRGT